MSKKSESMQTEILKFVMHLGTVSMQVFYLYGRNVV